MARAADIVKPMTSAALRRGVVQLRFRARALTSPLRRLPDFLVIGALRCGTSSLFKYLSLHPAVAASLRKEVGYFTLHYDQPLVWYRAHFPLTAGPGRDTLAFEATPNYLFHPLAANRAARLLPDAKLVVLLRDPVERAISHHELKVRTGVEILGFPAAVAAEPARLAGEVDRLRRDPSYAAPAHHHFSYLARGRYAAQLEEWFRHFPRERFHVIRSEDLFAKPAGVYQALLEFLGLPPWTPPAFRNHSGVVRPERRDRSARRALLAGAFADDNARLADLLGRDFHWDG